MKPFATLALTLAATTLLSGCGAIYRNAERTNNSLYEGTQKTRARLASYIYDDSTEPVPPQPHPLRYCYDVRSDVVCYDQLKPQLDTQRVGTNVAEASTNEFEVTQLYDAGSQRSNGTMVGGPTDNMSVFFNPAQPNQNNLRFNGGGVGQGATFVPSAPDIRGIDDPVSNAPTQQRPFGFSQPPSFNRAAEDDAADMMYDEDSGGPATMNTQGPPPTKPPAGFEGAPSPLIQNF